MQVILANPRGFCAGVDRAIEIVDRCLDLFEHPIYVRHEVVHNSYVVNCLKDKGAIFIEDLDEVPDGATLIFSAHGVSQAVRQQAKQRGLKIFDATCPLVTKVHLEVIRYSKAGYDCILIGHSGHPEVEGTMGQFDESHGGRMHLVETAEDVARLQVTDGDKTAYVTQTTLSLDDTAKVIEALRQRFPHIRGPKKNDICYATQNRQDAVKTLANESDLILVVGSANSSNSNRLKEVSERIGLPAYLIDNEKDLQKEWFEGIEKVGLTAGASAPDILVQNVIKQLQQWGGNVIREEQANRETVVFSLPRGLKQAS